MPGDNADKINYMGELEVLKFVYGLVETADKRGRFGFTKTRDVSRNCRAPGGPVQF